MKQIISYRTQSLRRNATAAFLSLLIRLYMRRQFSSRFFRKIKLDDRMALVRLGLERIVSTDNGVPTKLQAYRLIKTALPDFEWQVVSYKSGKPLVEFKNYPTIDGERPSLKRLVGYALGHEDLEFDPPNYDLTWKPLFKLGPAGKELGIMLQRLCYTPPAVVVEAIAKWLEKALAGVESVVFSPVCPDWAINSVTQRYTFDGLGEGVGLVAVRILAVTPEFANYCQKWGLNIRFVFAIGDFEATSESCTRLGISHEEFLRRLSQSQEALRLEMPGFVPLETPFITTLGNWGALLTSAGNLINASNFSGPLKWSVRKLHQIAEARRSLYERWHGKSVDVVRLTVEQGREYGVIGKMVVNRFPNPLVLAGDQAAMAAFWQALQDIPLAVVYLRGDKY